MNSQRISAPDSERRAYRRLVAGYSILFALLAFGCSAWFIFYGRTNIWHPDGYYQHYPALRWFIRTMRGAIAGIFTGKGGVSEWSFALGEGNDVLNSLHYYVLGDPINLLALFFPEKYTYIAFGVLTIVRLYLSGLAFLWLCRQTGKRADTGLMIAVLVYVFAYWSIRNGDRHPYFLNPMIWLPLLIGSVERVLQGKSFTALALSTCLAGVSNFYFFYVLGVLTALYCLIRLIPMLFSDWRAALRPLGKLLAAVALGLGMAAIILIPVIRAALNDTRMTTDNNWRLFYPLAYYVKLPQIMVAPITSYWTCVGMTAPCLLASLMVLIRWRRHKLHAILLIVCLLFCAVPAFGQALNGFAYLSNRWSFAFALVIAYSLVDVWPELQSLDWKTTLKLAIGLSAFSALAVFCYVEDAYLVLPTLGLNAIMLILLLPRRKPLRFAPQIILGLAMLYIFGVGTFRYASFMGDKAFETTTVAELENETTEIDLLKQVVGDSDEFIRYSGRGTCVNRGLLENVSATRYYWSLSNPAVTRFVREMGIIEAKTSNISGYNDRTPLLALSAVNWFAKTNANHNPLPYGYSSVLETDDWTIAHGDLATPLTYVYDSWTTEDTLEPLSFTERQEAMLKAAVLDSPVTGLPEWDGKLETVALEPEFAQVSPDVTLQGNSFVVTRSEEKARLYVEGVPNSETFLEWKGLDYKMTTRYELYCGDAEVDPDNLYTKADFAAFPEKKQEKILKGHRYSIPAGEVRLAFATDTGRNTAFTYYTRDYNFYNGAHDFALNLGDYEKPLHRITIRFPAPGIYTFDSLKVYAQPLEPMEQLLAQRRSAGLTNQVVTDDRVTGEITLAEPRVLVFAIPASDGWSATVDGAPAELHTANYKYMALTLEPGVHSIELNYHRPGGRLGVWVTVAAWAVYLALVVLEIRASRRQRRA